VALIVNWRGSDELVSGSAKAPTDDGLITGQPQALDADGREHLELRELAVNYSAEDPCIWLRKKDNSLAKFRPTAGIRVVDRVADLPRVGTPAAAALRTGDTFLVRYAPDGSTPLNRLVVWDQTLGAPVPATGLPSGDWNWDISPRHYIKDLLADADVAKSGAAAMPLQEGDLQLTIEGGSEQLKVYVLTPTGGQWVEVFGWETLRRTVGSNHWAGRFSDLPSPSIGAPITEGSAYMVALDLLGEPLDRLFIWKELTPEVPATGAGAPAAAQTGEWHMVDQTVWVKGLDSDGDNLTDAANGDLTVTLEKGAESIKVFDGNAGAWVTVPATDTKTVQRWIASLSLFQGTVVEVGHSVPGAIDFASLPDLSTPSAASLRDLFAHYWIFVGTSGYTVSATDPQGLARDVLGAKLNPGDWLMVANRSTDPAVVDVHWVVVSGDLLSATRARTLYSHETWRPGSYEAGTVIVYDKSLWRSSGPVTAADAPPRDGVNVAQVDDVTVTAAAALPIGTTFTLSLQGKAVTYATTVVGESAATVAGALIFRINNDPVLSQLIKAELVPPAAGAGTTPGAADTADIKLSAQTPGVPFTIAVAAGTMTSAETTANVTLSPWTRIDLAGGVRWVATDADRNAITNSPRQNIIYVLTSAENRGNGALYYWDAPNAKWQILGGGGGVPLKLTGGQELLSVGVPVGAMMMWMGATAPRGWLLANGQTFDPTAFPELAKVFPTNQLPDLRGAYLRGAGQGTNGWGSAANVVGGRQEDSTAKPKIDFTTDRQGAHTHNLWSRRMNAYSGAGYSPAAQTVGEGISARGVTDVSGRWMDSDGDHSHTITGGGDAETRPKTVFINYIFKCDDAAIVLAP